MWVYQSPSADTSVNLSLEDVFFEAAGRSELATPGLFLYRNAPSLVVGRNQNVYQEIRLIEAREKALPIFRRSSGGGAVYHDGGNLNFAFFLREDRRHRLDFAYYLQPVVKLLLKWGLAVELRNTSDLFCGDAKISGNAQHMGRGILLHHGTLLVEADLERLGRCLRPERGRIRSKAVHSRLSPIRNIGPLLGGRRLEDLELELLASASCFLPELEGPPTDSQVLETDISAFLARPETRSRLAAARQRLTSFEWTYGRAANYSYHHAWTDASRRWELDYRVQTGRLEAGASLRCDGERVQPELLMALAGEAWLPETLPSDGLWDQLREEFFA